MAQKILPLETEDVEHLEKQRAWVMGHYVPGKENDYETVEGKLLLLQTILTNKWIEPTETWKLQSLGIALGDAIVQELLLEWVIVEDETGRDPALNVPGTTIKLYPLTMISKRVERGEDVDVRELFSSIVERMPSLREEAD